MEQLIGDQFDELVIEKLIFSCSESDSQACPGGSRATWARLRSPEQINSESNIFVE